MRIAIIGQAAFGGAVLKKLAADDRNEIVGVFAPPSKGKRDDPIVEAVNSLELPLFQFASLKSPEAIEEFKVLEPDLAVLAFVTQIVPMEILNYPRKGTIQYHPSLLPLHRGPSSINWPIVMGETETGLSIFWPDEGLDTGPLLLQKTVKIGPDDTLGVVYFQNLFPQGVDAMIEAVELVRQDRAPKTVQDETQATYEGWFTAKEAAIDWSKPGAEVYNLVRGSDPQPGANTTLEGQTVSFYDTSYANTESNQPAGTVVSIGETIEVAVSGGTLTIGRVRGAEGKVSSTDFAKATRLQEGSRFGN